MTRRRGWGCGPPTRRMSVDSLNQQAPLHRPILLPHPLRLVMHLPPGQPEGHLNLQGKRANHGIPVPLHPLGLQLGLESSTWVFPAGLASIFAGLRRCDPGSNLGPPVEEANALTTTPRV